MSQQERPIDDGSAQTTIEATSSVALVRYHENAVEHVRRRLPEVARQLKSRGVCRVRVEYDGCGDEGQITHLECLDERGQWIDPFDEVQITEDALTDLFYDLIEARHPAWENNDGAYGELEWNLATDALLHRHHERFVDTSSTEHEDL